MSDLVKRLRADVDDETKGIGELRWLCTEAADRIEALEKLDREAATHVESAICLRSKNFTGEPPYVGWKGLGLALEQDYARIEALEAEVADLRQRVTVLSPEEFARVMDIIDNPPKPTQALRDLFATYRRAKGE